MCAYHPRLSDLILRTRFAGVMVFVAFTVLTTSVEAGRKPGSAVDVQVLENSHRIVLHYALGAHQMRSVSGWGEEFQELLLPGEPLILEAGKPSLPKVCRSIVIPHDDEMTVRVLAAEYREVYADIAPSRGALLRATDPAAAPQSFDKVYRTDAFYPGKLVQLGRPYILRDCRGLVVELYPFQYNPVTRVLRVYSDVTVEILPTGPAEINVPQRSRHGKTPSRAFHQLYKNHFVNYRSDTRYPPLDEEGGMLIIVHDPWLSNVAPLALHKNSIGIDTTVVGVSTIGNNATAIKNHIQSVYDVGDLTFVLLVGDAEQVATPDAFGEAADPTYAKLAGDDNYPDIMVGRFSAQAASHVETQVRRTIAYEQMPATMQDWFWRGAGIGSEAEHLDNIRDELLAHGYTQVDQIYDPNATSEMVTAALNDGRGIVNYLGQGGTEFWGTGSFFIEDVEQLANADMLPFIFSVASMNGRFTWSECFAEAWLRAEHGSVPVGAIAAYMSANYLYWDGPQVAQEEFVHLYVNEAYVSFGALCFAGACRMMDEYGAEGARMLDNWIVFGDPSLRVVGVANPLGDLNGDGCVDQADLGILLADWGCAGGDCPGDCDGDGDTDQADLGLLLGQWGVGCP